MQNPLVPLWQHNKGFLLFLLLMFAFRSSLADWNDVPSGSMHPTLIEGDRILVNKMAYDLRIPFTLTSVVHLADPARGDVVVFESEAAEKRLVKRVVGLPGDTVALYNNRLYINGTPLAYETSYDPAGRMRFTEHLPDVTHDVIVAAQPTNYSSFAPVLVPAGHYLVLGDNRDHSADSRVIGFVPRGEIIGRTRSVVLSLNYENYLLPRTDRFLQPI